MTSSQVLTALLPVLIVMTAASLIELIVPLRTQPRFVHGRVQTNLTLVAFNICMGLMLNTVLLSGAVWVSQRGWGLYQQLGISGVSATLISLLVLDLAAYATHVMLHKVPFLWQVHLVHHNDVSVDATTAYRHHPIEPVLRWGVTAIVAWSLGVPLAALALYRTLSAVNAILEHANIRVPRLIDRTLIWFWVTPDMHKVHHSRVQSQTDSNYANLFAFYDRLFGTFTPTAMASSVSYGIDGHDKDEQQTMIALLRFPFERHRGATVPVHPQYQTRSGA